MNKSPLVSVVINCYNGASFLKEALDSVIYQDYNAWEIVFIDNCSTDISSDIVFQYNHPHIKYYKTEEKYTLGEARNIGLSKCLGEYITFLDVDDIWDKHFLSVGIEKLETTSCELFYSNYWKFNNDAKWLNDEKNVEDQIQCFRNLLQSYVVPMSGAIVKTELLKDHIISFSKEFSLIEDYDFFLRIAYYTDVYYTYQPLISYRMHPNSQTVLLKAAWGNEFRRLITLLHNEILSSTEINLFKVEIKWLYVRSIHADICYFLQRNERLTALKLILRNAYLSIKLLYPLLGVLLGYSCFQKIDNRLRNNKYKVVG